MIWRLSGDLPMRPGETLSLMVTLPNEQCIKIRSYHVSLLHHRQAKESYLPSARLSNYSQIAPQNRVAFNSTAEAEEAGYRRAGNCP